MAPGAIILNRSQKCNENIKGIISLTVGNFILFFVYKNLIINVVLTYQGMLKRKEHVVYKLSNFSNDIRQNINYPQLYLLILN